MERFYISTYKSPIGSDILVPHYLALFAMGVLCVILNYILETRNTHEWFAKLVFNTKKTWYAICSVPPSNIITEVSERSNELQAIQTDSNGCAAAGKYDLYAPLHVLNVHNLSKTYNGNKYVLENVSFQIQRGEVGSRLAHAVIT